MTNSMTTHTPIEWIAFDDTQMLESVNGHVTKIWISKQQYDYANVRVNVCAGVHFAKDVDPNGLLLETAKQRLELFNDRDELERKIILTEDRNAALSAQVAQLEAQLAISVAMYESGCRFETICNELVASVEYAYQNLHDDCPLMAISILKAAITKHGAPR